MRTRVYLDTCCYGRLFDEQESSDIRLETNAIVRVQQEIENGNFELAWSFALERENAKNPYEKRRIAIAPWKHLAAVDVGMDAGIFRMGLVIEKYGIRTMDALHIACAINAGCQFFLTTDKKVLNKRVKGIRILDPLSFVQKMEAEK